MKLRNKKTGEIGELSVYVDGHISVDDIETRTIINSYDSLAKLYEDWEDVEEPKQYWFINDLDGEPIKCELKSCGKSNFVKWSERRKQIGNYFETEEEAELAVQKLKAWKRLRDRGVVLDSFEGAESCNNLYRIIFSVRCDSYWMYSSHPVEKDLRLLLGGEDE